MWQFFGKRVIQLAHHEALNMGHSMVEAEHLLLGLLQEGDGVACQALQSLGVNPADLAAHIRELIGGNTPDVLTKPVDLPVSPRANKALDLAMHEARKMGVNYVDTGNSRG